MDIFLTEIDARVEPVNTELVNGGLSTGDEVNIVFDYDAEMLAQYGLKIKEGKGTYTVEELPEVQQIDVFANFSLPFSGISPQVSTQESITGDVNGISVTYTCAPFENLKIGDVVTVTASVSEEGYAPAEATKEFTVEGVDAYITNAADITAEEYERIKTGCLTKLQQSGNVDNAPLFVNSIQQTGIRDVTISTGNATIANINLINEAEFFCPSIKPGMGINSSDPNTIVVYYECDVNNFTSTWESEKQYNGKSFHAYGEIQVYNLIRKADGQFSFEQGDTNHYSDFGKLYVDKADIVNIVQQGYIDNFSMCDRYKITLDGSAAPELIQEAPLPTQQ